MDGFHASERDQRGRYRWSTGESHISFPQLAGNQRLGVRLNLGPPPPTIPNPAIELGFADGSDLRFNASEQARIYYLLLPERAARAGQIPIKIQSEWTQVGDDERHVSLRFEGASLRVYGAGLTWPNLWVITLQGFILLCGLAITRALQLPLLGLGGAVLLLLSAGLIYIASVQALVLQSYLLRLAVVTLLLTLLSYSLLPWLIKRWGAQFEPDLLRAFWGASLVAIALRLTGVLYPTFAAHDLALNVDRLLKSVTGNLLITNHSFEFGGGTTVYPPGPYLTIQPLLLFGITPPLLVAGAMAFIDGLNAFAVGLLAQRFGLDKRSASMAAMLFAAVPVTWMPLFFGHSAQIFGQAMMLPLLLALLAAFQQPDSLRYWMLAGLALSVALLSHIGVTVIAVAWLGIAWLLIVLRRVGSGHARIALFSLITISSLIALALIYGMVLGSHLEQTQEIGQEALGQELQSSAAWLIWRGFLVGYNSLGLILPALGLALFTRHKLPSAGWQFVLAWLLVALLFLAVELSIGLQVRYIYFLAPLVCVLSGYLLGYLSRFGRLLELASWAIIVFLLIQSSTTWYNGVLFDARVSMVALLR
jgi:4-amino-4-deoxy-L-arabinose transferase and related glycosyltransferases of PMT family